ncbi:MAG: 2,4-diaminopentanoate dehydrogenase [Halanaerobium sp.]|nr:2,4-diaminopentanoate dehydrogenase [Halanaerobium sp.]
MTRVVLWGLGSMGSGMAKILLQKEGIEIVGAIAKRESKRGKDLGEVLGIEDNLDVIVHNDAAEVLEKAAGDIILHATNSFVKESFSELKLAMEAGYNVITIAEEMAYPVAQEPEYTERLDRLARENGVTILGTGINPGFILDTLIIAMTGVCADVKRIKASRINDLSPFGPTVMKTQGVGTTVEEFAEGVKEGNIVGHIGFPESINMIADSLGWELDEIIQTREPIITNVKRETPHVKVEPGMVAGCKHIAHGMKDGEKIITLEHPQQIHPELEGTETGDYIKIEGTPAVNLAITPEIPGGIGTMAVAINMVPRVIAAGPGLVTMKDLPLPAAIMGDMRKLIK